MDEYPIRILLVEDNPADVRLVREYMSEVSDAQFDLVQVGRLSDAAAQIAGGTIDLILLDLSLPDSRGLDTFTTMRKTAPDLPIIVLTGLDDTQIGLQTVEQGAQDYLVKGQVTFESLARSVRYALVRHQSQRRIAETAVVKSRGKVLSFIGAKGGVGTTSIVLNLGIVLAQKGKNVVAAELTGRTGGFSAMLGRAFPENVWHIVQLGLERIVPDEVAKRIATTAFGLRILFGPQKPEEVVSIDTRVIEAIVASLAGVADYVVLDLGSGLGEETQAAIARSDYVALVTQPRTLGIRMGKLAVDTLKSWGVGEERLGAVIVNRFGLGASVSVSEYREELGCELAGVMPPDMDGSLEAEQRGVPCVVTKSERFVYAAFVQLADRLVEDTVVPLNP